MDNSNEVIKPKMDNSNEVNNFDHLPDEMLVMIFEMISDKEVQEVYFKDYLVIEKGDKEGKYVLELVVENPLLNKKVTLVEEFEIL